MKIAKNSHNNLRQAIRSFEATWYLKYANACIHQFDYSTVLHSHLPNLDKFFIRDLVCRSSLEEDQETLTGWEEDIVNTARNIIAQQTPIQ